MCVIFYTCYPLLVCEDSIFKEKIPVSTLITNINRSLLALLGLHRSSMGCKIYRPCIIYRFLVACWKKSSSRASAVSSNFVTESRWPRVTLHSLISFACWKENYFHCLFYFEFWNNILFSLLTYPSPVRIFSYFAFYFSLAFKWNHILPFSFQLTGDFI